MHHCFSNLVFIVLLSFCGAEGAFIFGNRTGSDKTLKEKDTRESLRDYMCPWMDPADFSGFPQRFVFLKTPDWRSDLRDEAPSRSGLHHGRLEDPVGNKSDITAKRSSCVRHLLRSSRPTLTPPSRRRRPCSAPFHLPVPPVSSPLSAFHAASLPPAPPPLKQRDMRPCKQGGVEQGNTLPPALVSGRLARY